MVPLESADYAVCSGLFDDTVETPQDYRELIARMHGRGLTMICANPDVVVERGDALVFCAGAIADLYAAAGGEVIYAGKPYRPIYEQALAIAEPRAAPGRPSSGTGHRGFGAYRSHGRRRLWGGLPFCDRRHPRRGARRTRHTRR